MSRIDRDALKAYIAASEEQAEALQAAGWPKGSELVQGALEAAEKARARLQAMERAEERSTPEEEIGAVGPECFGGSDFGLVEEPEPDRPTATPFDDVQVELSPDQAAAVRKVLAAMRRGERILAVDGPAGTGKTTLVKVIAREALREGLVEAVVFVAPTGKAALRLRQKGCQGAGTIHAALYTRVVEKSEEEPDKGPDARVRVTDLSKRQQLRFSDPVAPCPPRCLLVGDEASMIPYATWRKGKLGVGEMLEKMLPPSSFLLYVGDTAQLPPVEEAQRGRPNWVPALEFPTASLETIHRQASGNPIIEIATQARLRQGCGTFPGDEDMRANLWTGELATPQAAAQWLSARRQVEGLDSTLITWRNETRQRLNQLVRSYRGLDGEPVSVGDRLVVRKNNHKIGLMNGEVITAVHVREIDPAPSAYKQGTISTYVRHNEMPPMLSMHRRFKVWLSEDRSDFVIVIPGLMELGSGEFFRYCKAYRLWDSNLIHCTYGECLTVHASQGSEWPHVGVYVDTAMANFIGNNPTGPNLYYTAVTRAAEQLHVFWGA